MKIIGALLAVALAGSASAQIIPLGAPIIAQPRTKAVPPPSQGQSGQMRAARPLGSNYSPYSIQPQGSVTAAAPSTLPYQGTVSSGVVVDPNAPLNNAVKKPSRPVEQSDMQRLAPKAAERTEMPKADDTPAASPAADEPPKR